MFRLVMAVLLHLPSPIIYNRKMKKAIKKNKSREEKYEVARNVVLSINKKSRIKPIVFGEENLPVENGYVLYPSHQGKYDGLAMVSASKKQLTFVIDDKRSHISIEGTFMDLIEAKRIDKTKIKQTLKQINEVGDEVKNGVNYCIFPEGGHNKNRNNLQEFYTGCFRFLHSVKCPIVPVCLYDTYKVYEIRSFKKVYPEIHILKPISYKEYKDLNVKEIAELVKKRIQEKLDEIKIRKSE